MYALKTDHKRWLQITAASIVAVIAATTSYAAKGVIQDRRVTPEMAKLMLDKTSPTSEIPLELNDRVLKQLNRFLGTPEGRDFLQKSLVRYENYRDLISRKTAQYSLPEELAAVGLVESGFQNREQDPSHREWGAGLWMFIESSARAFGLRVELGQDERLNTELETDAAMRYLLSNQLRFRDWRLAILAYNIGERHLQAIMDKTGSRNPWQLIQAGAENDRDYLAKVIAAILIMKNPESLK